MLGTLGNFLQVALTLLTLASLAGLGLMRGIVTNLRENLRDARDEINDKDRRLTDAEAEIIKLKAKATSQAHDLDAVGRLVRGETYWSELGEKLNDHHSAAETHWEKDESLLQSILAQLDGFTDRGPS